MRGGLLGEDHVLRDLLAHHRERLDANFLNLTRRARRRRLLRLLQVFEDVVLRDAAGNAGALDPSDVDVVLRGDLAHERGGLCAAALVEVGDVFGGLSDF